jgi:hypothetical protein
MKYFSLSKEFQIGSNSLHVIIGGEITGVYVELDSLFLLSLFGLTIRP